MLRALKSRYLKLRRKTSRIHYNIELKVTTSFVPARKIFKCISSSNPFAGETRMIITTVLPARQIYQCSRLTLILCRVVDKLKNCLSKTLFEFQRKDKFGKGSFPTKMAIINATHAIQSREDLDVKGEKLILSSSVPIRSLPQPDPTTSVFRLWTLNIEA